MQSVLFCPLSLLQRSPHLCFWLSSAVWYFHCLRQKNKCAHHIMVTQWVHTFSCKMIVKILVMRTFCAYPHRFVGFNNTHIFVLCSPTVRRWSLQGIAAGIGISNFLRAFFMIPFNSSSSRSMKYIPRNLLAFSSFGFSIAHFCFSLRFDASDICFHISGHNLSGLEVVCFLVSLASDHQNPSGGYSSNTVNLCETCPRIWQFSISINVPIIFNMFLRHHI